MPTNFYDVNIEGGQWVEKMWWEENVLPLIVKSKKGADGSLLVDKEVKSVLGVALELHMQNTGAMDFEPTYDDNLKMIELRLHNWKPSHDFAKKFDDAVKTLLEIVVDECKVKKQS